MSLAALCAAGAVASAAGLLWELAGTLSHAAIPDRLRRAGACVAVASVAGWFLAGPLGAVVAGCAAPLVPSRVAAWQLRRRRAVLAAAAPGAARAISDALAGGHSIRGAIGEAAGARPELRSCADALALGARTDDALEALRAQAPGGAWDTLIAAILLQRDAGGDLALLLRELAMDMEAAARAEADAKAATSQARFTGWLVAALPLGGLAMGELASPGSVGRIAASPIALALSVVALVLQIAGIFLIRRLAASA
jgi:tight adherence protein B